MPPPPRVQVVARYTGDRLVAPRTNAAEQLAEALRSLNPELNETLRRYGAQRKTEQEAKARADALRTSGKRFADAVRDRTIRGSQNPWYVAAYNNESARLASKTQLSQLQIASQQWEEKNDPAAFQARWNEELAGIAEQYTQIDQQAGFQSEANVATQHVIESNTRLNMQRIETERADNLGKLVADAVRTVNAENGGNASPEQVHEALAGLREQAIGTGGTQEEWDRIVQAGVVSAAYNMQDADLIDILKFERADGKGSIYNIPGVADAVEADKFRIRSNSDSAAEARVNAERLRITEEGGKAVNDAYDVFGMDILKGTVDPQALISSLEKSGHSSRAIAYAFNDIQRTVSDSRSLSTAAMTGNTEVLDLYLRARQKGYSPQLKADITNAIVAGTIDVNDGVRFLDTAIDKNRQDKQDVDSDESRAAGRAGRQSGVLRDQVDQIESFVARELQQAGVRLSSKRRDNFEQAITDAALAHLSVNPDDFTGALAAAQQAGASILSEEAQRRGGARQAGFSGGAPQQQQSNQGNPRR